MSAFSDSAGFLSELINAIKESLTSIAEGPKIHLNPLEGKKNDKDDEKDEHGEHEEEVLANKGRKLSMAEARAKRVHLIMKRELRIRTLKGNVAEFQQGQHVSIMPLNEGADTSEQRFLLESGFRKAYHVGAVVAQAVKSASMLNKQKHPNGNPNSKKNKAGNNPNGNPNGAPGQNMVGSKQGHAGTSSTRPNGTMTRAAAKPKAPKVSNASRPKNTNKVGSQKRKSTGQPGNKAPKTSTKTATRNKHPNSITPPKKLNIKRPANKPAPHLNAMRKRLKNGMTTAAEQLVFQPKRGDVVQALDKTVPDSRVSDVSADKVMLACRNLLFGVNKKDVDVVNRIEPALTSGNVDGSSFVVWLVKNVPSHPLRSQ
jgi:hypothetical protein